MARNLHWFFQAVKIACAAVIFASALYVIWAVGPAIETRLAPVVGKLQILAMRPGDLDGTTEVHAAFEKRRDCEYVGISWFHGSKEAGFERVPIVLLRQEGDTSSPNRPVGYQKAGPWIVGVPPDELVGNSFAQLQHRCWPFWLTTTDFFP